MVGYSFLVTDGPDLGRTFTLTSGITILGRLDTPSAEDPPGSVRWTLTDPAVSRTHAQITWDGEGTPVLAHLSTTNATLLNGRIVTGQSIDGGQSLLKQQSLRLGQTSMEVQEVESGSGWRVLEGTREIPFTDAALWARSGIALVSNNHGARVLLTEEGAEAYLLRRLDGLLWSTPLRKDVPVTLAGGDILRLAERRLMISSSEG